MQKWGTISEMKKLFLLSLTTITSLSAFTPVYAIEGKTQQILKNENYVKADFTESTAFKLYINGQPKQIENTFAVSNNRTFLPMREVSKLLGVSDSNIKWDSKNETATINQNSTLIEIPIGRTKANVNDTIVFLDDAQGGTRSFKKETSAGGVTYLPLRFLAENLGYKVKYYSDTNVIHIYNQEVEPEIANVNVNPLPTPPANTQGSTGTTLDGVPIDPLITQWGGVLLDETKFQRWTMGTHNNTGSYPFDFDGDGLINGYNAEQFSIQTPAVQRNAVMRDFSNTLKSKITPPTTPGTNYGDKSPDKHFVWGVNGWRWSPSDGSYYDNMVGQMSQAINAMSTAYLK